jgi:hypothetical protein
VYEKEAAMADLQRVDLLLPKILLRRLKKEAQARHGTFSSLVRETLQLRFPGGPARGARMEAVRRLQAMSLPVGPWTQMEADIDKGRSA